jgi:hypothetical protein
MAVYIRRAHKAEKYVLDLGVARNKALIAADIVALTILDKGTGTFTLHFKFYDGTEFDLTSGEVATGDKFEWDITELRVSNTAQPGVTLKLLADKQVVREAK